MSRSPNVVPRPESPHDLRFLIGLGVRRGRLDPHHRRHHRLRGAHGAARPPALQAGAPGGAPVDVTPRGADPSAVDPPPRPRRKRNPAAYVLLALVVVGLGVVLFQGLNNAALYYRNVDEALDDKASLGTSRFRVQGTVQDDVKQAAGEVDFTISFNGKSIPVQHRGDPPELFKAGVPVVLEGHFQGDFFESDRILIKHTAEYKESNPERVGSDAP